MCTGPLYLPKADPEDGKNYIKYQVIGKNNVAVPTHFFKVVVGEMEGSRDLEMEAYVLPNEKIPDHVPIQTFQVRNTLIFLSKSNEAGPWQYICSISIEWLTLLECLY